MYTAVNCSAHGKPPYKMQTLYILHAYTYVMLKSTPNFSDVTKDAAWDSGNILLVDMSHTFKYNFFKCASIFFKLDWLIYRFRCSETFKQ